MPTNHRRFNKANPENLNQFPTRKTLAQHVSLLAPEDDGERKPDGEQAGFTVGSPVSC